MAGGAGCPVEPSAASSSSNINFGDVPQPCRDQFFTSHPKHGWCSLVPDLGRKHSVPEGSGREAGGSQETPAQVAVVSIWGLGVTLCLFGASLWGLYTQRKMLKKPKGFELGSSVGCVCSVQL